MHSVFYSRSGSSDKQALSAAAVIPRETLWFRGISQMAEGTVVVLFSAFPPLALII